MVDCHGFLLNTSQWDLRDIGGLYKRWLWIQNRNLPDVWGGVGGMGGTSASGGGDDDDLYIIFARNILLQTSESLQIC